MANPTNVFDYVCGFDCVSFQLATSLMNIQAFVPAVVSQEIGVADVCCMKPKNKCSIYRTIQRKVSRSHNDECLIRIPPTQRVLIAFHGHLFCCFLPFHRGTCVLHHPVDWIQDVF